jgi:hypothetical protein
MFCNRVSETVGGMCGHLPCRQLHSLVGISRQMLHLAIFLTPVLVFLAPTFLPRKILVDLHTHRLGNTLT